VSNEPLSVALVHHGDAEKLRSSFEFNQREKGTPQCRTLSRNAALGKLASNRARLTRGKSTRMRQSEAASIKKWKTDCKPSNLEAKHPPELGLFKTVVEQM